MGSDKMSSRVAGGLAERCAASIKAGSRSRAMSLLAVASACLISLSASAGDYRYEYDKKVKSAQDVGVLGNGLVGDQVNFLNGATTFTATDISIPGNSGLSVALSRTYSVEYNKLGGTLGDWDLDIPYLSTIMSETGGWVVDSTTPLNRCSVVGQTTSTGAAATGAPPAVLVKQVGGGFRKHGFSAQDYWHGYSMHLPGGGEQSLLLAPVSNTQRPTAGGPYHWTTNKDWWFSCLPATAQLGNGQGFLAIAPDGTKYWFDRLITKSAEPVAATENFDGPQTWYFEMNRMEYRLVPSRVEDRFGNWVQYEWSGARLNKIWSNDGRTIMLYPQNSGLITSASDGTKTWNYTYSGSNLTQVTLPDQSTWKYGFSALSAVPRPEPFCYQDPNAPGQVFDCYGGGVVSPVPRAAFVEHPSGARVDFNFDLHFQFASTANFSGYYPFSIKDKTISGPGLTPATWRYGFAPSRAEATTACQAGSCPVRVVTDEVGPDNSVTRRIFDAAQSTLQGEFEGATNASVPSGGTSPITCSARWGCNILGDVSPVTGAVPVFYLERDNRYVAGTEVVPYLVRVGVNPLVYGDTYSSERRLPIKQRIITQQGVTFSRSTEQFNEFAQTTKQLLASAGGAAGNFSRRETATYLNNTAKWALGLNLTSGCIDSTDCGNATGRVLKRTEYDPSTLLPWKLYGVDQVNPEATLTYNANGTLATAKDGRGNTTTLNTWELGIPKQISFPSGSSIYAELTPQGFISATRDEFNSRSCYGYDPVGRLTSITYTSETAPNTCDTSNWNALGRTFAKSPIAEYGLPIGHWQQTVTTGNAKTTTYYDVQWRPVLARTEDTSNSATRSFVVSRYDAVGRQIFKSYPVATLATINDNLKGARTSYDGLGRVILVQQDSELVEGQSVLNSTTSYLSGFRTQVTNPRGKATTTSYQVFASPSTDAPVSILHPASVVTTIARQPSLGKPLSVTRGQYGATLSATRSYVYDSNERLCKTINPESNSALVDYDLAGNVTWSADGMLLPSLTCDRGSVPLAERTNRYYDTMNRVTWVQTPGNIADVSTSYFADGSVNTIAAANPGNHPVVTSYAYNRRRLMTGEASQNGATVFYLSYGYNANAHLSALTYPDGQVVGYAPDALGRTTQVAVGGGQVYASGVTYHPTGAISGFTYGNQIAHSMTPNVRQLPARSLDSYGGTTFLDDTYAYDANGNVDYVTDALPVSATSHTRDLGYDDLDRLIVADSPTQVWGQATYSYDPIDNLRSVDMTGGPVTRAYRYNYEYPGSNRLTDIKSPTGTTLFAFGYDARGNTTSKNGQARVFDVANRLNEVTGVQTYRYDGLGRRVQTTDADGKTTFWMYSQSGQVIYSSEARRSQNISYLYLGNTQVATRSVAWGTGATTVRYQHTDALGSPVLETSAPHPTTGVITVLKRNVFTPWGETWGTTVVDGTGYTGHVMDQGTGLTYMQQRYYDPQIGRFLSVDPVPADPNSGDNFSSYWYANNNPFRFIDPDGRLPKRPDTPDVIHPEEPPECNIDCKRLKSEAKNREQNSDPTWSLPGTESGAEAAQVWADLQTETGNPLYAIPGLFASLWTPETAGSTAWTLGTGGSGRVLTAVKNLAGRSMYMSRLLGPTGSVFGRTRLGGSSLFGINSSFSQLRIGWGWIGTGNVGAHTLRISGDWVKAMGVKSGHIDIWISPIIHLIP